MKKRFMSIILCAAMSVTILSGCSGGSKEASEAKDSGAAQSQVDESTEAARRKRQLRCVFYQHWPRRQKLRWNRLWRMHT